MNFDDLWTEATANGHAAPAAPDGFARSPAVARRLRHAREAAGFGTSSAAALAFGWPPSKYLAHESGDRPVAPKQLAIYAEAFGVAMAWLQTGEGAQRRTGAVPPQPRPAASAVRAQAPPGEAMLRAARDAVFRLAVERGLVPAAVPWDQTLAVAETWREIADAAVKAAWAAKE